MLRKLATLVLVVPLSLNGLWMVCADASALISRGLGAEPQATAECEVMCPLHKPAEPETQTAVNAAEQTYPPGALCVLTASEDGTSILLYAVAVAAPAAVVATHLAAVPGDFFPPPRMAYASRSVSAETPPPEA